MAFAKKKDEFRIPSLIEASSDYAALIQKLTDLNFKQSELRSEIHSTEKLLRESKEATGERLSQGVAALLGEEPDSAHGHRQKLVELRRQASDVETAIEIQTRRIAAAKSAASALVVAASREEYQRRVAAVAKAAAALHEARLSYLDMKWQFEAEDVSWTPLGPLSIGFLGDHVDGPLVTLSKAGGNV